jgi:hypothetical protein
MKAGVSIVGAALWPLLVLITVFAVIAFAVG